MSGEEVRVAGAKVGTVDSVEVSGDDEIVSREGGDHAVPGKAVVVMDITDSGFKDFRSDASCIIRPQSLIGERYVDCTPTQPYAPGQTPPPELPTIPDDQPGAGQHLLPLENNGTTVDLDLVQNIQRLPFRDRFRLILNELGAGLAARGQDLGEVIDRANPALRQTDRVLNILAQQSRELASLASNGDAALEPLARHRTDVTGFFHNAAISGQATAERGADLEAGLSKLPATLHQVRLTMGRLKQFADQGTPLFADLKASGTNISKATQKLAPFARAGIPALTSLGDAGQSAGPKLAASDPLLTDLSATASSAVPVGKNLSALLDTFVKTQGFQNLRRLHLLHERRHQRLRLIRPLPADQHPGHELHRRLLVRGPGLRSQLHPGHGHDEWPEEAEQEERPEGIRHTLGAAVGAAAVSAAADRADPADPADRRTRDQAADPGPEPAG